VRSGRAWLRWPACWSPPPWCTAGGTSTAPAGRYHALILIFLAASVDFCLTGDLIGQALAGQHPDGLVVVAFALLAGGFLIKAAVVPRWSGR
jgi:hypothetical protein